MTTQRKFAVTHDDNFYIINEVTKFINLNSLFRRITSLFKFESLYRLNSS